jgi:hypothetical protein
MLNRRKVHVDRFKETRAMFYQIKEWAREQVEVGFCKKRPKK